MLILDKLKLLNKNHNKHCNSGVIFIN